MRLLTEYHRLYQNGRRDSDIETGIYNREVAGKIDNELLEQMLLWELPEPILNGIARKIAKGWHNKTLETPDMSLTNKPFSPLIARALKQYHYLYSGYPEDLTDELLSAYDVGYSIQELISHDQMPSVTESGELILEKKRINSLTGIEQLNGIIKHLNLANNLLTSLPLESSNTSLQDLDLSKNRLESEEDTQQLQLLLDLDVSDSTSLIMKNLKI